jgi:uncharacterized membrane-anchored protein
MAVFHYVVYTLFLATFALTVFYSFVYRRQTSAKKRGLFAARMNMSMGAMLLSIALLQIILFSGSTVRVIFGAVCLVLGLFNMFAGIRNHGTYARMKE